MSVAGQQRIKWTKSQFVDLYDHGFLDQGKRYELLDGDILERMSPIGLPHSDAISELRDILRAQIGSDYKAYTSASVELTPNSMPEPDLFVLSLLSRKPGHRFAVAKDVVLVVEVSDTTLSQDRGVKKALYAEAGLSEYWIVNLGNRTIEVYREPDGGDYKQTIIVSSSETISPLFNPSVTVEPRRLFEWE